MSTRTTDPTVTIVVPVYNDPEGIVTTVESLQAQQTDREFSIAIVDNGSTDNTPAVIAEYTDERTTLYHENEIQSSYAARNTGIRNSDSDIFGFIDADMTVPEDWIVSALDAFRTEEADYMGCDVKLTLPENPTVSARYDHHTGFPVEGYLTHQQFAPTCCLFVRRAVFEDVGLFDHRLESGGDKEFGTRVYEAGYDQYFAADVTMYHPVRESLQELITKDLRVGRGLCQAQRNHPDRFGNPGVPPRPSGIKRPDRDLPTRDRINFSALSTFLTGVRGLGYYHEYLTGN